MSGGAYPCSAPSDRGAIGVSSAAPEEVVLYMCWGPEDDRETRDAQEEIRLLFDRYRGHPAPAEPPEALDDEDVELPEREREYTLSSVT
jgi:hypothetical protein